MEATCLPRRGALRPPPRPLSPAVLRQPPTPASSCWSLWCWWPLCLGVSQAAQGPSSSAGGRGLLGRVLPCLPPWLGPSSHLLAQEGGGLLEQAPLVGRGRGCPGHTLRSTQGVPQGLRPALTAYDPAAEPGSAQAVAVDPPAPQGPRTQDRDSASPPPGPCCGPPAQTLRIHSWADGVSTLPCLWPPQGQGCASRDDCPHSKDFHGRTAPTPSFWARPRGQLRVASKEGTLDPSVALGAACHLPVCGVPRGRGGKGPACQRRRR